MKKVENLVDIFVTQSMGGVKTVHVMSDLQYVNNTLYYNSKQLSAILLVNDVNLIKMGNDKSTSLSDVLVHYLFIDQANIYKALSVKRKQDSEGAIVLYTKEEVADFYIDKFEKFLNYMSNRVEDSNYVQTHIPAISNSTSKVCKKYYDVEDCRKETRPTPLMDSWLSRFNDVDVLKFKVFMHSLLREEAFKPCLYMYDSQGSIGKSKILQGISKVINPSDAGYVVKNVDLLNINRFTLSNADQAVLITSSENKDPKILKNPLFKQITGGDSVNIENKGIDSRSATLTAKWLIFSNTQPYVDNDKASSDRVLLMNSVHKQEIGEANKFLKMEDGRITYKLKDSIIDGAIADEILIMCRNSIDLYEKYVKGSIVKGLANEFTSERVMDDIIESYLDVEGDIHSRPTNDMLSHRHNTYMDIEDFKLLCSYYLDSTGEGVAETEINLIINKRRHRAKRTRNGKSVFEYVLLGLKLSDEFNDELVITTDANGNKAIINKIKEEEI